jgi:hypothetical protein
VKVDFGGKRWDLQKMDRRDRPDNGRGALPEFADGQAVSAPRRLALLLCTALLVRALGANGTIGALNYAFSILGLGSAAIAGTSGRYPVLILLGGSNSACIRVDGRGGLTIAAYRLASRVLDAIGK